MPTKNKNKNKTMTKFMTFLIILIAPIVILNIYLILFEIWVLGGTLVNRLCIHLYPYKPLFYISFKVNNKIKMFSLIITILSLNILAYFSLAEYNNTSLYLTLCMVFLYTLKISFFAENVLLDKYLADHIISSRVFSIFFVSNILTGNSLFTIGIIRFLIIIFMQLLFEKKVNIKTVLITFVIVMFFTYFDIVSSIAFLLYMCSINYSVELFSVRVDGLYMNTRGKDNDTIMVNKDVSSSVPESQRMNTIITRQPHISEPFLPEGIHNKTPYAFHTEADVEIAKGACRYISKMSKEDVLKIAENEVRPVLLSHKNLHTIDLTYVQLAVLKSLMSTWEPLAKNKYTYGGTIKTQDYLFNNPDLDIPFKGPTNSKSNFYKEFDRRLGDAKQGRFDLHKSN